MSVVSSIVGPIVGGGGGGGGGGIDTSDANAVAGEILSPKTAYVNGVKLTGTYTLANATASGDAAAYHLKTGKKAWVDGAEITGTAYFPAAMDFDGSSGYYYETYTSAGNKVTAVLRFKVASKDALQVLMHALPTGASNNRLFAMLRASNDATVERRNKLLVLATDSSAANCLNIVTSASLADNAWHTVFVQYDADAGTAQLVVDGASDINTGAAAHLINTATLSSGDLSDFSVGGTNLGATPVDGLIAYAGMRDVGGRSWSDFMHPDGTPKNIESTLNTVWGAQPLFWNESGYMQDNKGSAGAMTANGTIVVAPASSWS